MTHGRAMELTEKVTKFGAGVDLVPFTRSSQFEAGGAAQWQVSISLNELTVKQLQELLAIVEAVQFQDEDISSKLDRGLLVVF